MMSIPEQFGDRKAYEYQTTAKNEAIQALIEGHDRVCVVLPTGAGKTITAGLLISDPALREVLKVTDGQPVRVLMFAHRHRLLNQAALAFNGVNGIRFVDETQYKSTPFSSLCTTPCSDKVLFTTLSSFGTIPDDLQWDIVLQDEGHHESCLTFQYKLEQIGHAPIIGLTATPNRADGTLIKFSKFIETISRADAVDQGFLSGSSLYSFVDSPAREHIDMVMDIVELKHDILGQTMIFVRTKKEASDVQQQLVTKGYTAAALIDIREKVLNAELSRFERKELQFVISCNKLGEGTDVKNCESIIIGRTLQSLPFLNQMVGRSTRKDSKSQIFEIINPLSNKNLDATSIIDPLHHEVWYKVRKQWRHQVIM